MIPFCLPARPNLIDTIHKFLPPKTQLHVTGENKDANSLESYRLDRTLLK